MVALVMDRVLIGIGGENDSWKISSSACRYKVRRTKEEECRRKRYIEKEKGDFITTFLLTRRRSNDVG